MSHTFNLALADFSSQVTAPFLWLWWIRSYLGAHWLFVIVVRSSLVMRANWKWINEVVTGVKKKIYASFSFSIQCPFLMEALPLLELIHGHFMWFAYPASRETHNIARIKSLSLLFCFVFLHGKLIFPDICSVNKSTIQSWRFCGTDVTFCLPQQHQQQWPPTSLSEYKALFHKRGESFKILRCGASICKKKQTNNQHHKICRELAVVQLQLFCEEVKLSFSTPTWEDGVYPKPSRVLSKRSH